MYVDHKEFIRERRIGIIGQLRKIEKWAKIAAEWEERNTDMSKEGENINWIIDRLAVADQQVAALTTQNAALQSQLSSNQKDAVDTTAEARLQALRDQNPDTPAATAPVADTGTVEIPVG